MAFDTTRLIAQVTLHGGLPTGRFEVEELLDIAYDTMLGEIVPEIIDIREEYYVRKHDDSIVAGQADYPIVSRALAGTLRELKLISGGSAINDLDRRDPEDISAVRTGTPDGFYLQGNDVILDPTPDSALGTLQQSYFIRPSKFVTVASCAAITAIDTATRTVTVSIPSGWSTTDTFDLVKGRAHYDPLAIDLEASSVGAGSITFVADLPSKLRVGDYVTKAEETCFPHMFPEGHMALAMATAAAALQSIGDPRGELTAGKAKMLIENFKRLIAIRVQGAPKMLSPRII